MHHPPPPPKDRNNNHLHHCYHCHLDDAKVKCTWVLWMPRIKEKWSFLGVTFPTLQPYLGAKFLPLGWAFTWTMALTVWTHGLHCIKEPYNSMLATFDCIREPYNAMSPDILCCTFKVILDVLHCLFSWHM